MTTTQPYFEQHQSSSEFYGSLRSTLVHISICIAPNRHSWCYFPSDHLDNDIEAIFQMAGSRGQITLYPIMGDRGALFAFTKFISSKSDVFNM